MADGGLARVLILIAAAVVGLGCAAGKQQSPDPDAPAQGKQSAEEQKGGWRDEAVRVFGADRLRQTSVRALRFSTDGDYLVSSGRGGLVKIWDRRGDLIDFVSVGSSKVHHLDVSPDGKWIAVAERRRIPWLLAWDGSITEARELERECGDIGTAGLRFLADSRRLVVADRDVLCVLEMSSGTATQINVTKPVRAVERAPGGGLFLLDEEGVKKWRGTGEMLEPVITVDGRSLAVSSKGTWALVREKRKRLVLAPTSGASAVLSGLPDDAKVFAFSPDEQTLALGDETTLYYRTDDTPEETAEFERKVAAVHEGVEIFDIKRQQVVAKLGDHGTWVSAIAFSPDGSMLASTGQRDNGIQRWDPQRRKRLEVLEGPLTGVDRARPVDAGSFIVTEDGEGVRVWNTETGKAGEVREDLVRRSITAAASSKAIAAWAYAGRDVVVLPDGIDGGAKTIKSPVPVVDAAISADGSTLVTAGASEAIQLWDLPEGTHRRDLTREFDEIVTSVEMEIAAVDISAGGERIAVASFGRIQVWDGRTGKTVALLEGHGSTNGLSLSADGLWLATVAQGDDDPPLRVWAPPEYAPIPVHVPGDTGLAVAVSPDGSRVAAVAESYDNEGEKPLEAQIHVLRFNGDRFSVTKTLRGHSEQIRDVAFLPDGHRLVSASDDTTARLWDVRDR